MTPQKETAPRVGGHARANDENQHAYYSILERLRNLPGMKGTETKFMCCCPAHEDRNPSLSVTVADDGTIGLKCFSGCNTPDVVAALDGTMADLFPPEDRPAPKAPAQPRRLVRSYVYHDKNGVPVGKVDRFEPKHFTQSRFEQGKFIPKLNGMVLPLYRLPEVQKAKAQGQTIYLVEGEKDVEALVKMGLCATTNAGGAAKWQQSFTDTLSACDVVILPDNDEPGMKAAWARHKALPGSVVVTLPDLPHKGDVSDWIAQGGTVEGLRDLVEHARANPVEPDEAKAEILPLSDLSNWRALAREPIDHIFYEGLAAGTLGVIAAEGGTGKSFAVLTLSISVALGRPLMDGFRPTRSGRVLCCFAEDDMHVIARRIDAICAALNVSPDEIDAAIADGRLQVICGRSAALLAANVGGSYSLTDAHAELVERCQQNQYRMIVVDPVIAWAGVTCENDNAAMQQAAAALIALAKASGGAALAPHHANKQAGRTGDNTQALARGGSALVDASRWVATMRVLTDTDAKDFNIPIHEIVGYVEIRIGKNSYAERTGHRTFLKREEGGALVSVDLQPTGKASLLDAIVAELTEKPINLTSWEMYKSDGKMSVKFREAVSKRAGGIKAGWRAMQTAINSGLETGALVEKINPQKPDHPFIGAA